MKTPFVTREQLSLTQNSLPFHLYDEAGIRETARALHQAFAWNEGFKNTLPSRQLLTHRSKNFCKKGLWCDTASYVGIVDGG